MTTRFLAQLARELATRGQTVAVAESCTGGGLGWHLTALPGSSVFFKGGVIAYANEAKQRLLGIPAALLARHGAVSGHVARAMAAHVRRMFRATYGIAITGIAGPSGGTAGKPVGTVWLAVAGPAGTTAERHRFRGSRARVRAQAVDHALRMVSRGFPPQTIP